MWSFDEKRKPLIEGKIAEKNIWKFYVKHIPLFEEKEQKKIWKFHVKHITLFEGKAQKKKWKMHVKHKPLFERKQKKMFENFLRNINPY